MSTVSLTQKPSSTSTADTSATTPYDSPPLNARNKRGHQPSTSMEQGGIVESLYTNTNNEDENDDVDLLEENIKRNTGRNSSVKRKKNRLDSETKKRKTQTVEEHHDSDDTSSEHHEQFERGCANNETSQSELDHTENITSRTTTSSRSLKAHKLFKKTSPKSNTDSLKLIHLALPVYNNNHGNDKTKSFSPFPQNFEATTTSHTNDMVVAEPKHSVEDTSSSRKMIIISIIFIFVALVYIILKHNELYTQIESMSNKTSLLPEDQKKVFQDFLQNQISYSQKQLLESVNIKLSDLEKRVNIEFEKNMNNNILSVKIKNQKDMDNMKDLILDKVFSEIEKVLDKRLGQITESHREEMVKIKDEMDNIIPSMKSLIDDSLSKYAADKIGLADYALSSLGSKVVEHSPTYNPTAGFWPLFSSIKRPDIILTSDTTIGNCWPMKGGSGFVVIELASPIIPTAFSIDHVPRSLTPNFSSAPRQFTVFAYENSTSLVKIHTFEYDIKGPATQTFYVEEKATRKYQRFRFQISSNYGNHLYTCLYRLRIHETTSADKTFAAGLMRVLEPITTEYDHQIREIQLSQTKLAEQIDNLSKKLDQCKEDAQFINVTPYLQKLANSRKKVINISTTLGHISDRLNRLNKLAKQKYPELEQLRQQRERMKQHTPTTPKLSSSQPQTEGFNSSFSSSSTTPSESKELSTPPSDSNLQQQNPPATATETPLSSSNRNEQQVEAWALTEQTSSTPRNEAQQEEQQQQELSQQEEETPSATDATNNISTEDQ
ncbi:hypothetical protein C9374_010198 [Naegleria lovaniensis]|uniref:SUN domain-containing protein n=1 Tax=Naegleria lovaniensis TaxID=51637 RepID=A0AA88GIH5_NAELO|nr:uncharacterized protein C9374_010198 [Naegleria lovaniensis]KAG2375194.1 hypothetical protein C9374_010198 [Naegleria lovaniensis]